MTNTKKVKRRFNFKRTIAFLLFLYLIYYLFTYFYNLPIKNIVIKGTTYLKDYEIIEVANLKKYPSIFKLNTTKTKKNILSLSLVSDVKIKRKWGSILEINIIENKILFYKKTNNLITLSNKKEITSTYLGFPILINYVPDQVYDGFISSFSKLKYDTIKMINEIEYFPSMNENNEIIDETRFKFYMNDGNIVISNNSKLENLDYYLVMLSSLDNNIKGIFSLDSGNYDNFVFRPFEGDEVE